MGILSGFNAFGGNEYMPSVKDNYQSANTYVKSVEQAVNRTKSVVKDNKSDGLFTVSPSLLKKNNAINQKYEVSGDAATKNVLEDWTAIVEMRNEIRTDSVAIDNEAKIIEERFRQIASLL